MSSQASLPAEPERLEALSRELAALEGQVNSLHAAIRTGAWVRRLLGLTVLVLLAVFLWLFYSSGRRLMGSRDQLLAALGSRAAANTDRLRSEAQTLFDNVWPTVREALQNQFEKDLPKFTKELGKQWETLQVNVSSELDTFVEQQYQKAIDKHWDVLQAEFPEVKDPDDMEAMKKHFQEAMKPIIAKYYGDRLVAESKEIATTLDEFPRSQMDLPTDELADQLYSRLWELFITKTSILSEIEGPEQQSGEQKSRPGS